MQIRETANLLGRAALVDGRDVTPEIVAVWHEYIGGLRFDVAMAALDRHRATSDRYLEPAHILTNAKIINQELAHDAAAQIARRALPAPEPVGGGIPAWVWERANMRRVNEPPAPIKCPHCGAPPRERCTRQSRRRGRIPLATNHPSRTEALATSGASSMEDQ